MMNNKAKARTSEFSAGIALEHPFGHWKVGNQADDGMDSRWFGNAILCLAIFHAFVALAVIQAAFLVWMILVNLRG